MALSITNRTFSQLAAVSAILAGVANLAYAVSFVIIDRSAPDVSQYLIPIFLLLGGLLVLPALVALTNRVTSVQPSFAQLAYLLAVVGAFGAAIHGGYDLALAINGPAVSSNEFPSQVDPRGLLTFGATGLALLCYAWLIARGRFARDLASHAALLGLLAIAIYVARLVIYDVTNPVIVILVVVTGFIVNPLFYIRLGLALRGRGL